jgi:hypothetical protein
VDFPHLVETLRSVEGRDAWVAVTSGPAETARAAVMHGGIRSVDVQEGVAFVPVDIPGEPQLTGSIGVALDQAEFERAEGSLPGDLFISLRDYDVRVATR